MIIKELFAKLGLTVDETGFVKAQLMTDAIRTGLSALGNVLGAAVTEIKNVVLHTSEMADHLDETAQATGINVEALQEFAYAASFSGMSTDDLSGAMVKLTRTMKGAADGSEEQAKAFASVGVAVKGSDGKLRDAGDVMADIAEHFKAMPDGADKTAQAISLFGKSGARMIPFLNAGRDGLAELRAEAHELGVVMDESTIKQGAELDDTLTRIKASATGLQYTIGGALLSAVNSYGKALLAWTRANRELMKQRVEKVVDMMKTALMIALVPIKAVATTLGFIVDNWRMIAVVLSSIVFAALVVHAGLVWSVVAGYVAAGAAGVKAAIMTGAAWVIANLPLIAMTVLFATLILLIDDFYTWLHGGKSVMGEWFDNMTPEQVIENWKVRFKAFLKDWLPKSFKEAGEDIWNGIKIAFGVGETREQARGRGVDEFWDSQTDAATVKARAAWKAAGSKGTFKIGEWMVETGDYSDATGTGPFVGNGASVTDSANSSPMVGGSSTFKADIVINPPPGASPGEIAGETASRLDDWHAGLLSRTAAEL